MSMDVSGKNPRSETIPTDGLLDGGELYTKEEMEIILREDTTDWWAIEAEKNK